MLHNNLNDAPESFFSPTGLPLPHEITNGNVLRNINSYEYLGHIAQNITKELADKIPSFKEMYNLYQSHAAYDPEYAYGNLYTRFLLDCERNILFILFQREEYELLLQKLNEASIREKENITHQLNVNIIKNKLRSLQQMLHFIYANPNQALERSFQMIASSITAKNGHEVESIVTKRLDEKSGGPRNDRTPQSEGSAMGRLTASLSRDFKPITTTSIPSIRTYEHQKAGLSPIEYRFGTQAQINVGSPEINPLFTTWLDLQKDQKHPERITHIYFNNLALTNTAMSLKRECELSSTLHALTNENLAVITLPSYMSLMNVKTLTNDNETLGDDYAVAKKKMLQVATGIDDKPVEDFYMSERIKRLLYGVQPDGKHDIQRENETLDDLLEKSFKSMGVSPLKKVSLSKQQAVFFHFIKFELTNFILEKLQPDSFNVSCKDAIDRGGVASAYYNLIKSIKKGVPLSEEEFLRALHGAPTLVKGRGMNFHIKIIWNAIDHYLEAHDKMIKKTGTLIEIDIPTWLRVWRDENAPSHSKIKYTQNLTHYIHHRARESNYLSFFGEFNQMDLGIKLAVANKLLQLLEDHNNTTFSQKELITLKDGRLGELFSGIQFHKILPQPQPLKEEKEPTLAINTPQK